jgi:hypothetical protein
MSMMGPNSRELDDLYIPLAQVVIRCYKTKTTNTKHGTTKRNLHSLSKEGIVGGGLDCLSEEDWIVVTQNLFFLEKNENEYHYLVPLKKGIPTFLVF